MTPTIEAIYEEGRLRPIPPWEGLAERSALQLTVEAAEPAAHPLADCVGIFPREDVDAG